MNAFKTKIYFIVNSLNVIALQGDVLVCSDFFYIIHIISDPFV
jgi:hypothetical protein